MRRRRICFVTGTRAEFGLMASALSTIRSHPRLALQLIATGMHLDPRHGDGLAAIRAAGFRPDVIVPWPALPHISPFLNAAHTGDAITSLSRAFDRLRPDVVLLVGDRVEAFAAASAAHLCRIALAHVHGGDRALGQTDDALRHAITKLAHIHFSATRQSASRIAKMGEEGWRIHRVGSPGLDGILHDARPWHEIARRFPKLRRNSYALLLLHPVDPKPALERARADLVLRAVQAVGFDQTIIIHPNNDPGASGILRRWRLASREPRTIVLADAPRPLFLGLLRDAAVLVGNSSTGIIEAASFHTPVLDIGPRQSGRERSRGIRRCDYNIDAIRQHLTSIWNQGHPRRLTAPNVYGGGKAGERIAQLLAQIPLDQKLMKKLIRY